MIDPFLMRRDWHWIGLDGDVHNWNPWIHGNVLVAALRLLAPEDPRRVDTVALCIEGLDRYVASLPEDGAIDEGYAYWWNGACRALEALDVLRHATGGRFDPIPRVPALRATVAFPLRCRLGGDWYLNLADGQAKPPVQQPWHSVHGAAIHVGDDAARADAASRRRPDAEAAHESEGTGRVLRGITDAVWIAAQPEPSPLPVSVWLPSTQVMLARRADGSADGLTLSIKGGHNDEHHNHNDVGSFVVASDGVPVVVDVGRPTYTARTFGPGRYDIWTMQSSWHNVPEIRGTPQRDGAAFRARDVVHRDDGRYATLSLDLADAYPLPTLTSWHREATLDQTDDVVTITDSWTVSPPGGFAPDSVRLHLVLAGAVSVVPGLAEVVPLDGATPVSLRWPVDAPTLVETRELDDPLLSDVWGPTLTRLTIEVGDRSTATVRVERNDSRNGDS